MGDTICESEKISPAEEKKNGVKMVSSFVTPFSKRQLVVAKICGGRAARESPASDGFTAAGVDGATKGHRIKKA